MGMLPRLGLAVGVAVAVALLGPAWPTPAAHPLAVAPLAGVLAAAVLGGAWEVGAAVLLAAGGVAVAAGGLSAPWAVVTAAPVAAAAVARLRQVGQGTCPAAGDSLEILGVAAGAALLAAALAGALSLPGAWGLAVGLGVLAVAPPVGRLLTLTAPPVPPTPAQTSDQTSDRRQEQEPPGGGLRLLVVEDDAVNRLVAQEILRAAGHRVVTAADGREGLQRVTAAEKPFDAVLLDLHMPGLDGTDVLRRIRALADPARAAVPVLLLSADVTPLARQRGLEAGADAFLTKPIDAQALLRALAVPRRAAAAAAAVPSAGEVLPEEALSEDAAVDLDLLEGRLGDLGRDSLGRILGLFQDAAPRHLARLRDHAGAGDAAALRREAHTLKGAAAVIGATRVCEAASAIEAAAGDATRVAESLGRLEDVIDATLSAVAAFARRRDVPTGRFRAAGREPSCQETSGAKT